MAKMEKHLFNTKEELQTYLTNKGFVISNNQMKWDMVPQSSSYWTVTSDGTMNFHTSSGENAFYYNLTDFSNEQICGCIFIELANNGCALYLTPLPKDFSINDLTVCCANNYTIDEETGDYVKTEGVYLQNGLVVCTPAEKDGYWRYSWRDVDPSSFYWTVDNCRNKTTKSVEIPNKPMIPADDCVSITHAFLDSGDWSDYIFVQALGEITAPGHIFLMNGQKYIAFTDNTIYQAPVFRLAPEEIKVNISTSTQEYSTITTYKYGDYCIFNGLLWRCIEDITTPGAFDSTKWTITTVNAEIMRS